MEVVKSFCNVSPLVYSAVIGTFTIGTLFLEHRGRKEEERMRTQKCRQLEAAQKELDTKKSNTSDDSDPSDVPTVKKSKSEIGLEISNEVAKIVVVRPSVLLTRLSVRSQKFFDRCGRTLAWMSSYLTQIDLKELGKTLHDVGKPICTTIASPVYLIIGYAKEAQKYVSKEWMIYLGSGLVAVMLGVCWYYFSGYLPRSEVLGSMVSYMKTKFLQN